MLDGHQNASQGFGEFGQREVAGIPDLRREDGLADRLPEARDLRDPRDRIPQDGLPRSSDGELNKRELLAEHVEFRVAFVGHGEGLREPELGLPRMYEVLNVQHFHGGVTPESQCRGDLVDPLCRSCQPLALALDENLLLRTEDVGDRKVRR